MQRLMVIPLALASLLAISPYTLASAETGLKAVEATGSIVSFNDAQVQGLWAADADFGSGTGTLVSVFENDAGDIYVVTVKGEDLVFEDDDDDGQTLTIAGMGFVAKNGILLKEGIGKATITESVMEAKVNGDVVVSGQTVSITQK